MTFAFTADEMSTLNDSQKDAILEVLVAGVLANGKADDERISKFDAELANVPWGRSDIEMLRTIKDAFARISGFDKPEQAVGLVKNAAATITDPVMREKTFALLARVMYQGRPMSEEEQTVLTAFVMEFKLETDRLAEIAESVKKVSN